MSLMRRLEAERIGERTRSIRARPWPERPVSAANKSGSDTAATQPAGTNLRLLLARPWPERPVSAANKSGNDSVAAQGGITCPLIF